MLVKFLIFVTVLFSFCLASPIYPKSYAQLGTPLFESVQHFQMYEDVKSLKPLILEYKDTADKLLLYGKKIDTSDDKNKKKNYLKSLRKLQSKYDKLLYSLHQAISKSIKDDDYELFLKLTSYAFDGLFTNTNLRQQAIDFYFKHKHEKNVQCEILEKNMTNKKLANATQELFATEIINSSYNSDSQKKSKKSVDIITTRVANTIKVFLYNKNIYDVTIRVRPVVQNIKMTMKPPKEFVLKAKSKYHYTTLVLGSGESRYGFSWSYTMGSKDAQHDKDYVYRLPFKQGTSHIVSQGYNGEQTHKGGSAYSIDFVMPVGTKVYAARDGVVVKTKSNSDKGGFDKKYASSGNYVRVMHSDGTFATYYHLKYHGVIVKEGVEVSRGEPLGYSGSTGYSSGPHLHFSVFKASGAGKRKTIPTKFRTLKGLLEIPIRGNSYEAI